MSGSYGHKYHIVSMAELLVSENPMIGEVKTRCGIYILKNYGFSLLEYNFKRVRNKKRRKRCLRCIQILNKAG